MSSIIKIGLNLARPLGALIRRKIRKIKKLIINVLVKWIVLIIIVGITSCSSFEEQITVFYNIAIPQQEFAVKQ